MALKTLSEIRVNIGQTVRETQVNDLIDTFINFTMQQIWNYHFWTFGRRKTTFSTVKDQENYNLDEEVDRLVLVRQRDTPQKIIYVPDRLFFKLIPNPEDLASGSPRYYRIWEETSFSTNLASADTVDVVSSSSSDTSAFTVRIVGFDSNGLRVTEDFTLNGTTKVTGSTTFQADGLLQVSKSAATTGTITVTRNTGNTELVVIAPEETVPRFKRLSLYPIPSSAITINIEYIERLRLLADDNDVPQIDTKWTWLIREGALAKAWEYKQNEAASNAHQRIFELGLNQMRSEDLQNIDFVPVLERRFYIPFQGVHRHSDSLSGAFPSYGVGAY